MHKHYIVVAHKNPGQVLRMIDKLADGASEFWLHIDAKTDADLFSEAFARPDVRAVTPRTDCVWGAFSQVETTLTALRLVLASGRPGYVLLISGQDYPIVRASEIDRYLDAHPRRLYLDAAPIEVVWPDFYREKTDFYCVPLSNKRGDLALIKPLSLQTPRGALGWARRLVRTFGLRDGLGHIRRVLPPRRPVVAEQHGGSSWWAMPWDVAGVMIDWLDRHPAFTRYFRYSQCPDETYFATALMQLPLDELAVERVSRNLHYVDWSFGDWERPKVLGLADLGVLLTQSEGVLLARKFDTDHDSAVLDALDAAVHDIRRLDA